MDILWLGSGMGTDLSFDSLATSTGESCARLLDGLFISRHDAKAPATSEQQDNTGLSGVKKAQFTSIS